jgi:hypothetical protein
MIPAAWTARTLFELASPSIEWGRRISETDSGSGEPRASSQRPTGEVPACGRSLAPSSGALPPTTAGWAVAGGTRRRGETRRQLAAPEQVAAANVQADAARVHAPGLTSSIVSPLKLIKTLQEEFQITIPGGEPDWLAAKAGSDFAFLNGDAFADATKDEVLGLIAERFGGVDYLI